MKFNVGDQVKIVGKSLGRDFKSISYSEGEIVKIYGSGDGSNENNCIVVKGYTGYISDWFAPQDLRLKTTEIEQMFDELIENL